MGTSAILPQDWFLFEKQLKSWESHSGTRINRWCEVAEKAITKSTSMGLNHIIAPHHSLNNFIIHTARTLGLLL